MSTEWSELDVRLGNATQRIMDACSQAEPTSFSPTYGGAQAILGPFREAATTIRARYFVAKDAFNWESGVAEIGALEGLADLAVARLSGRDAGQMAAQGVANIISDEIKARVPSMKGFFEGLGIVGALLIAGVVYLAFFRK